MTGQRAGLLLVSSRQVVITTREGHEEKTDEETRRTMTMLRLDGGSCLAVLLPRSQDDPREGGPDEADPDLLAALEAAAEPTPIAVERMLSSSEDLLVTAFCDAGEARRVPVLVAEKVTTVNDADKADFPGSDRLRGEGILRKAGSEFDGEKTAWAMQDGDGRVSLLVKPMETAPGDGRKVLVSGTLRIVSGRCAIVASEVRPIE